MTIKEQPAAATGASTVQDGQRALVEGLRAYASTQNELGRMFARHHGMHATDAAAVVEVLTAEQQDRPMTPARLAERLMLTTGATSTVLNRLEDAGHITRLRQHRDRRIVTIRSTPTVHESADAFFAPLRQQLDAVTSGRTPAELALVDEVVTALRDTTAAYLRSIEPPQPRTGTTTERTHDR